MWLLLEEDATSIQLLHAVTGSMVFCNPRGEKAPEAKPIPRTPIKLHSLLPRYINIVWVYHSYFEASLFSAKGEKVALGGFELYALWSLLFHVVLPLFSFVV